MSNHFFTISKPNKINNTNQNYVRNILKTAREDPGSAREIPGSTIHRSGYKNVIQFVHNLRANMFHHLEAFLQPFSTGLHHVRAKYFSSFQTFPRSFLTLWSPQGPLLHKIFSLTQKTTKSYNQNKFATAKNRNNTKPKITFNFENFAVQISPPPHAFSL